MQLFEYKDKLTYGVAMRDFVKLCKALSDETRLRILSILLERECCVCEISSACITSQTQHSLSVSY